MRQRCVKIRQRTVGITFIIRYLLSLSQRFHKDHLLKFLSSVFSGMFCWHLKPPKENHLVVVEFDFFVFSVSANSVVIRE